MCSNMCTTLQFFTCYVITKAEVTYSSLCRRGFVVTVVIIIAIGGLSQTDTKQGPSE